MAEMTKQANFRLSVAHVEIIGKLSTLGRMTKASVVEQALELLELRVAAGERIPETPPAAQTRQANFRLRVRHVEIINTLAASQHVTKATVVERALELLDAERGGAAGVPSSVSAPVREPQAPAAIPAGAVIGNTAVDLSVVEAPKPAEIHTLPQAAPARELRPAASIAQSVPEVESAQEARGAAMVAPAAAPATHAAASPAHVASAEASKADSAAEEQARKKEREEARRKERELREKARAEVAKEADKKAKQAIEEMRASLRQEAYKQAEAEAQQRIEAARAQAEASSKAAMEARVAEERARVRAELQADADKRIQEAKAQAEAQAQAQLEVRTARAEAEAQALEIRLNSQIETLQRSMAEKDAQISSLRGQINESREARRDEKLESLMTQLVENERRRDAAPAHMAPAPAPAPAAPVADPRIDAIMKQLEDQKNSSRDARHDDRMEALIGRLEQTMRDANGKSDKASSTDEIVKILQALNLTGQGAQGGVTADELARKVSEAREVGREEGLRSARAESEAALEAARETARREGYEAGQREAQRTIATELEEARTEGAFRERAKIANMRGWVFGEKRRYLKVHVTM